MDKLSQLNHTLSRLKAVQKFLDNNPDTIGYGCAAKYYDEDGKNPPVLIEYNRESLKVIIKAIEDEISRHKNDESYRLLNLKIKLLANRDSDTDCYFDFKLDNSDYDVLKDLVDKRLEDLKDEIKD